MQFDYDRAKSSTNKAKHGIDFEEAQALWQDDWLLEVPARTEDEVRVMAVGQIAGRHWTAIYTWRGAVMRIISVRRARAEEISKYEDESG
jgi:uncharacterized DUF497 family protein